ncbi:MAG: (2Fe-2S)-binding protein [Planctomycetes bacterium]|nr:(2Fe-2S)-binding protein [Planctomycetota bacterium]
MSQTPNPAPSSSPNPAPAPAAKPATIKIQVDGREVEADPKQPLIRACHDQGVDVPMYCYHPGLSPVGSCRICQVEVAAGPGQPSRVVAACRTPVSPGMVVQTDTPKAHETRRECLEFLLKNHPLDCPICDKAGECDLQDYSFNEGQGKGRSSEPRRKLEKRKSLGDVIVLDEERCILCSRCVRFFQEVTHKPQLTVSGLGSRSTIATFADKPLSGNYQGNIADICPVGALTLKPFRFQARVWNLSKTLSTCAECSRGCSITVEALRGKEVKRFRPRYNPQVNQHWMCDVGRFAYAPVTQPLPPEGSIVGGRLIGATIRGYNGLERVELESALAEIADLLRASSKPLVLLSPFVTQEEARAALELCASLGVAPRFVSPAPNNLKDDLLHTGDPCPNRRGLSDLGIAPIEPAAALTELASASAALLVGERVQALLGVAELAKLTTAARLVVLDVVAHDLAALDAALGVPTHVEKSGQWINVDGHVGVLNVAVPAPAGVAPLDRTLRELLEHCRAPAAR